MGYFITDFKGIGDTLKTSGDHRMRSMTAYATQSEALMLGRVTWEVRSVNHRFLDVSVHLPEPLRSLEPAVRTAIKQHVRRGKVDVALKCRWHATKGVGLHCNEALLEQLHGLTKTVTRYFPSATTQVMDVLNYRGVVEAEPLPIEEVMPDILRLLQSCLEQLIDVRAREGDTIQAFVQEVVNSIDEQVKVIKAHMPSMVERFKQRMLDQLSVLQSDVNQDRLEQECVWYAQKIDIAEELQRLEAHQVECQRIVSAGGVMGRQLDFLLQELNRETNTISSKSVAIPVTQAALEIKLLLEQMREQVQNIE